MLHQYLHGTGCTLQRPASQNKEQGRVEHFLLTNSATHLSSVAAMRRTKHSALMT